ncbi:MAG: hypothetical protein FJ387_03000 [Verrucomicrobia bacterium]|nr:hypothetical protein [Verrucomicrobiota bacterium]
MNSKRIRFLLSELREGLTKRSLTRRFQGWPLVQLLIASVWLRLAVVLLCASALGGLALFPRLWRSTPPGFTPEIRTSLLDKIQAWSLERSAQRAAAAGRYEDAHLAWKSACGNRPADPDLLRSLLQSVSALPDPSETAGASLEAGWWLLRLTQTNASDLAVVAQAWLDCGEGFRAASLLDAHRSELTEPLERLYLMSLFNAGRAGEFVERIRTNETLRTTIEQTAASSRAPTLRPGSVEVFHYYGLAYLAGWGPDEKQRSAWEQLQAARAAAATEGLATDLAFGVHIATRDIEAARTILDGLVDLGRAKVRHHAAFWLLLASEGKAAEAQELAAKANLVPDGALDIYLLATVQSRLGLWEEAERLLKRYTPNVVWSADLLMLHAELLARAGRWDELRSLALEMRLDPQKMEPLGAFSYFLEGLADHRQGRSELAQEALQKAVAYGGLDARLALHVGEGFLSLGRVDLAKSVLLPRREELGEDPGYLRLLVQCAVQLKEDDYLWDAAVKLYQLRPEDPNNVNNYAAMLLLYRRNPEEALRYTADLVQKHADNASVVMNHAEALLMNRRYAEAEQFLLKVDPAQLAPADATQFHLTQFEVLWRLGRLEEAALSRQKVEETHLFPVQARWLEQLTRDFAEERAGRGAGA